VTGDVMLFGFAIVLMVQEWWRVFLPLFMAFNWMSNNLNWRWCPVVINATFHSVARLQMIRSTGKKWRFNFWSWNWNWIFKFSPIV